MKVKICGITDKQNMDEILELHPDYLGFIFYPDSPRYMVHKLKVEDLNIIPKKVQRVGVFVNSDYHEIESMFLKYNLDFIQAHGDESPSLCKKLKNSGMKIIKAFRLDENFDFDRLKEYEAFCEYFLFDTNTSQYGGSGLKFNWKILLDYKKNHPFILSGGLGPDDIGELSEFNHEALHGIDLNSRFETNPGIKDSNELKKFLNKIRT